MRGKSILQVLPSLDSGGVERGTVEMVQAIVREAVSYPHLTLPTKRIV